MSILHLSYMGSSSEIESADGSDEPLQDNLNEVFR